MAENESTPKPKKKRKKMGRPPLKDPRGGKREGAGRPKSPDSVETSTITIRVPLTTKEHYLALKERGVDMTTQMAQFVDKMAAMFGIH